MLGGNGSGAKLVFGDRPTAADRLYDADTTASTIGYAPRYPMERGIAETIDAVREWAGLPPVEPAGDEHRRGGVSISDR